MVEREHFQHVMARGDLGELVAFLKLLMDQPDLTEASGSSTRLIAELADAIDGVTFTVPEFQDVVKKTPAVMLYWLAAQLKIGTITTQNLITSNTLVLNEVEGGDSSHGN